MRPLTTLSIHAPQAVKLCLERSDQVRRIGNDNVLAVGRGRAAGPVEGAVDEDLAVQNGKLAGKEKDKKKKKSLTRQDRWGREEKIIHLVVHVSGAAILGDADTSRPQCANVAALIRGRIIIGQHPNLGQPRKKNTNKSEDEMSSPPTLVSTERTEALAAWARRIAAAIVLSLSVKTQMSSVRLADIKYCTKRLKLGYYR